MRRFVYPLLISFGAAHACAQDAESTAGAASGATGESAVALHGVSEALAGAPPAASDEAAGDSAEAQFHRISNLLVEKFGLAREKADRITTDVISSASKYSLPPALVLAIISIESRFREKAHGPNGATGLMQVVPAAHRRLVRNIDLTQAAANIEAGSAILRGYIELARGDVAAALKSYGGSTAYARKVSVRARDFERNVAASDATTQPAEVSSAR